MSRSRQSRFEDTTYDCLSPDEAEKVTPDARAERDLDLIDLATFGSRRTNPKSIAPDELYEDLRFSADQRTDAAISVETRSDDGWVLRWVLAEQHGSFIVRSVLLEPYTKATPEGGITTNLLRELSPSRALAEGARAASDADSSANNVFAEYLIRGSVQEVREIGPEPPSDKPKRAGRPRLPDAHLAAVAKAYLEELRGGAGVLRRLGERFDRTPETMRDQVRIARREGFLTPAPKAGKKGAMPGPRLLEMMRIEEGNQ